jgi:hypothetical protein
MTYGPIDFIALEFKGNQFKGEILPALMELVNNNTIRIIDLIIVKKDEKGVVSPFELRELDDTTVSLFDPLKADVNAMIKVADINMIGEKLESNTSAALMLFENVWAVRFKEAVINANGRLVMNQRIPEEVVLEAVEDLALDDKASE